MDVALDSQLVDQTLAFVEDFEDVAVAVEDLPRAMKDQGARRTGRTWLKDLKESS